MDTWNKSDHGCMLRCTVAGSGLYGNVSSCFDHSRAQLIKGSELHFISNPSVLCLRADTTQQPATDATTLKHSSLRVSSLSALCTRFFVCTFLLTFLFFKDYFLPFYSIVETGGKHKERVTCNKAPPICNWTSFFGISRYHNLDHYRPQVWPFLSLSVVFLLTRTYSTCQNSTPPDGEDSIVSTLCSMLSLLWMIRLSQPSESDAL